MRTDLMDPVTKVLRYGLLGIAALYFIIYLLIVFLRIQYPFELMWQEGEVVDHVRRIVDGYVYYVSPSLKFVSSIYTPLFFYISAFISKLLGVGFVPLRLVSFFSSVGSFTVIYLIVKRETGNALPAFLASCLFAASFHLSGSWFDIGRPDSLFLFFCLLSLYVFRFGKSAGDYILAGVLMSLSFYTKQTALVISIPLMIYSVLHDRRKAVFFIAAIGAIVGIGSILLNYIYDGWFNFYVYELPRTTPIFTRYLVSFWTRDILRSLFIAIAIGAIYFISEKKQGGRKNISFYCLVLIGMLAASWYSRLRGGGFTNVLFPAYAIIAVLFGLGFNRLPAILEPYSQKRKKQLLAASYMLCIFQFGMLAYNPFNQIPSKTDLEAGNFLVEKLKSIEGEVFIPYHGYLTALVGKDSYANQMGLRDVVSTRDMDHAHIKEKLVNEFREVVKEKRFAAIVIDSFEPWYPPEMERYYVKKERIFNDETVFFPVTGMKTRPEYIYVPKVSD